MNINPSDFIVDLQMDVGQNIHAYFKSVNIDTERSVDMILSWNPTDDKDKVQLFGKIDLTGHYEGLFQYRKLLLLQGVVTHK
jgi:hypothetical protein